MNSNQVVIVPWYERDDYLRFCRMNGSDDWNSSYDDWLAQAKCETVRLIGRGVAAQIVRLKATDYLEWLSRRGAVDGASERRRFLISVYDRAGCRTRIEPHDGAWPWFPTLH